MKSGFVAVVGKPNAGKSTLINALIGQKISIVSEKPQTTRFKLRGILTRPEGQIVLVDTPGFHQPKDALGRYLNSQVSGTMKEVDLILFLVDASAELSDEDRSLVEEIKESKLPCVVVLTKKDISSNEKIDEIKKKYSRPSNSG
ncbi:MAG: GTPase Era [Candidatus Saccharicenans sp.]